MKLFDLHCDTAVKSFESNEPFRDGNMHINLRKGENLDAWRQIFAIFIPDNLRGEAAYEYFKRVFEHLKNQAVINSDKFKLCNDLSAVIQAESQGKCAGILAVEGGSPFANPEGAYRANEFGVKVITLTWNAENELGFGCQSESDEGLKSAGKSLLRDMEGLKIAADVSHLNRAGFYDAVGSGARVIASHSNSESVLLKYRQDSIDRMFSCRRSLNDDQIKTLVECSGLIGVNFCNSFLGDEGDDGFEAVYRHIAHFLDLGAENIVAIGSDFDGCDINSQLDGVEKVEKLSDFLLAKGLSDELLAKIFYENAAKFFENVLQ